MVTKQHGNMLHRSLVVITMVQVGSRNGNLTFGSVVPSTNLRNDEYTGCVYRS